jgi:asparagine synthase (glutamine-hydrolysing)
MCGFIASQNSDVDLKKLINNMAYRGILGYKGYHEEPFYKIKLCHYSLPFVNLDPDVAIQPVTVSNRKSLFVGEIFNYKELGAETDGICISDAFHNTLNWVEEFHKFDGFWSFVTEYEGSLIAITDYLAQKPIYYRTDIEAFASEIDVLKEFGPVTRDELFHSNTMKWGYDPTGLTPWNEIKQIPPGCYYHKGNIHSYWDWSKVTRSDSLVDDLRKATELRLGGEREVSILLSGGLDSSIVYGLIKELGRDVKAIHVENHEKDFASLMTKDLIEVTLDSVSDEDSVRIHQSPVDLGSVKPQLAMGKKLKQLGFNAVMTGDGADELFGGYRRAEQYDSQYSDVFCELPYYHLPKLDRTMMYYTIELRTPFLAPSVIKHALELPYEMRMGKKQKLIDEFAYLLPKEILERQKHPLKTDSIRNDPMKQRTINNEIWSKLYGR